MRISASRSRWTSAPTRSGSRSPTAAPELPKFARRRPLNRMVADCRSSASSPTTGASRRPRQLVRQSGSPSDSSTATRQTRTWSRPNPRGRPATRSDRARHVRVSLGTERRRGAPTLRLIDHLDCRVCSIRRCGTVTQSGHIRGRRLRDAVRRRRQVRSLLDASGPARRRLDRAVLISDRGRLILWGAVVGTRGRESGRNEDQDRAGVSTPRR